MNRYLQKILELNFRYLTNFVYARKYKSFTQSPIIQTKSNPLISIVVPVYKPQTSWLHDCIQSVINQTYTNWELILVDDHSNDTEIGQILDNYQSTKIKVIVNNKNLNIVGATNVGLKQARGEWVGFLDNDDILWPNALAYVAAAIDNHPNAKYIYTDQDKLNDTCRHFDPFLKKDFDFDLLRQANYINHFSIINKELLIKLNYLREGTDAAQDWDLILRASNIIKPTQIIHIHKILYSWRVSPQSTSSAKGIYNQQQKISKVQHDVLEHDLDSRHLKGDICQTRYLGIWSTDHKPTILPYQFHLHSLLRLLHS